MKTIQVIGTGSYLPENVISNSHLASFIDTSDDWIRSRTGIEERRIAKKETTVSMASMAARKAIENAGINVKEIDLILVTTMTPDNSTPNTACSVQKEIGASNSIAIDINTACSGFIFALSIVDAYVKTDKYHTALVISSEYLSKIQNWKDRSTCILFGDGAGAAILSESNNNGLKNLILHTNGGDGDFLQVGSIPRKNILLGYDTEFEYTNMDGKEIYKFAVQKVTENIKEVLMTEKTDLSEIKYFILHQANLNIITAIAKKLKQDLTKFPTNMQRYGNISSASLPILLDEINRSNKLNCGDKIVIAGFGGGLTWGAAMIEW